MYAMLTQKLSKGFKSWSDMLKENKDKLDELNLMRDKLCLDLENAEVNWMKKQEEL